PRLRFTEHATQLALGITNVMHVGLPSCSNWSDSLFVKLAQDVGREHQLAEIGAAKNEGRPSEEVVDLVARPQVQSHLGREAVEPILVVLRQRAARPQYPVREVGQV